jgi:uncharacterized damage-inducible protein DinB
MDTTTLLHSLGTARFVVNKNCEGINHEDSLIEPREGHHNFNWVLGHVVRVRNEILELLGKQPLYPNEKFAAYTPRDFTKEKAVRVEDLVKFFNALQDELESGVRSLTADKLNQPASLRRNEPSDETVGSILATVLWHEAYHAGQLGIIRRTIGRSGVIKNPAGE